MNAYQAEAAAIERQALTTLQQRIGEANAANGWHEEGSAWRRSAASSGLSHIDPDVLPQGNPMQSLRAYYISKLGLIITEVSEAIEELRNGHGIGERYHTINGEQVYRGTEGADWQNASNSASWTGVPAKPEGVPSELADVVIRCFDLAHEAGIDLSDAIFEKLEYNSTRGRMHGGKKI